MLKNMMFFRILSCLSVRPPIWAGPDWTGFMSNKNVILFGHNFIMMYFSRLPLVFDLWCLHIDAECVWCLCPFFIQGVLLFPLPNHFVCQCMLLRCACTLACIFGCRLICRLWCCRKTRRGTASDLLFVWWGSLSRRLLVRSRWRATCSAASVALRRLKAGALGRCR